MILKWHWRPVETIKSKMIYITEQGQPFPSGEWMAVCFTCGHNYLPLVAWICHSKMPIKTCWLSCWEYDRRQHLLVKLFKDCLSYRKPTHPKSHPSGCSLYLTTDWSIFGLIQESCDWPFYPRTLLEFAWDYCVCITVSLTYLFLSFLSYIYWFLKTYCASDFVSETTD